MEYWSIGVLEYGHLTLQYSKQARINELGGKYHDQ